MMEIARVFQENQEHLERSVVLAWWSGHSDARYSGSTWYYDHHWEDLKENCVAHIIWIFAAVKVRMWLECGHLCWRAKPLTESF